MMTALLGMLTTAALQAATLQPFTARYEVLMDGTPRGEAESTLRALGNGEWEYLTEVKATSGLGRLAGFSARQQTRFDLHEGAPRVLSARVQNTSRLRSRDVSTQFDWNAMAAVAEGDVDDSQPVVIGADSINAQLLNLALPLRVRDGLQPGVEIHYSVVERGRAREQQWTLASPQPLTVPSGEFAALQFSHLREDRPREIHVWIDTDPDAPLAPLRILQREDGKDRYELRLLDVN
jgi:hypothetical protein